MSSSQFDSDRKIWTDQDFDIMGWHDASVHAFAFQPHKYSLLFDLDYIINWFEPTPPGKYFTFSVAPATLVFENVSEVDIQIQSQQGNFTLQDIIRSDQQFTPNGKMVSWHWLLEGNEGFVSFRATGFKQIFRKQPILTNSQELTHSERGGLSVDTIEPPGSS